ncbi:MAG: restriction endonuclease [Abitibacteriaceae bacterium]|nr:restriction endonuclease [Abditibacteriaceae bacterium]
MSLLRHFLIPTGTLGTDRWNLAFVVDVLRKNPDDLEHLLSSEYNRRLLAFAAKHSSIPPWEGITWALDLLPHFPRQAISAIDTYFLAHAQQLPDGRIIGLSQSMAVIRAKFIGFPRTQEAAIQFLLEMHPRSFEHLIERLYKEMGYETQITPPKKDGGRDILTKNVKPGKLEHSRIECKRYSAPIGVEISRALLGVVSDEKVNKGVIVTTSRFTKGAKDLAKRNPRLELIDGEHLVPLLNEHFGPRWPLHIERIVLESQKEQQKIQED